MKFMKKSAYHDKLDRLYTLASWTRPWSAVSSLHLDPRTNVPRGIYMLAKFKDMQHISSVPLEVALLIHDYSRLGTIWQYASLLERFKMFSKADTQLRSLSLREISFWERGGLPTVLTDRSRGTIRLTIDSQGLSKIERLRERPNHQTGSSNALAYVVEPEKRLGNITVDFKACITLFGLAHLNTPRRTNLNVWDRPCPPNLMNCYGIHKWTGLSFTRMTTVDTQNCTGITFFIGHDQVIHGIHAHTKRGPDPKEIFDRIYKLHERSIIWGYLPLPPGDSIETFGARIPPSREFTKSSNASSYLFRTTLSGDIALGLLPVSEGRDVVLGNGPNPTLISYRQDSDDPSYYCSHYIHPSAKYLTALQSPTYNLLGTHSSKKRPFQFRHIRPRGEPPFERAYFSSAPLEGVTRVHTFEDKDDKFCQGIILEYANGSQRAIGQCRFGLDPVTTVVNPSQICLAENEYRPKEPIRPPRLPTRMRVRFFSDDDYKRHKAHDGKTIWKSFPVKGTIEFWFHGFRTIVRLFENSDE
ncbi:hypothetical protein BGZ61DRAFT_424903 [Ilyonectria robusta]|uniref:uncharacterized protein n=1 Tax=Ilyonectria robusta TaxID=1079257 RepID=UPI001E8D3C82|nr:uncharacterized protein BGZ61DRAFT_424903 [Ilyonectria robusta]KAH8683636.1 hypothetical protein BGZ61DRAFT_424903 [Ilyonectria robusta]